MLPEEYTADFFRRIGFFLKTKGRPEIWNFSVLRFRNLVSKFFPESLSEVRSFGPRKRDTCSNRSGSWENPSTAPNMRNRAFLLRATFRSIPFPEKPIERRFRTYRKNTGREFYERIRWESWFPRCRIDKFRKFPCPI